MDVTAQKRLLSELHKNIANLPQIFTDNNVISQDDIARELQNLKLQVEHIASQTYNYDDEKNKQIQALQLEIDFVKKLYLDQNIEINNRNSKYKSLYEQTLRDINENKKRYKKLQAENTTDYKVKIRKLKATNAENEKKIKRLTIENKSYDEVYKTLTDTEETEKEITKYLKIILKSIYPDDEDSNIESMKNKILKYLEFTSGLAQTNVNLNKVIAELDSNFNTEVNGDGSLIQLLQRRCNDRLQEISTMAKIENPIDASSLITLASQHLTSTGEWVDELDWDDKYDNFSDAQDETMDEDDDDDESSLDKNGMPKTPGSEIEKDAASRVSERIKLAKKLKKRRLAYKAEKSDTKNKKNTN